MSAKSKIINLRTPFKRIINIKNFIIALSIGVIALYWLSAPTMRLLIERDQNLKLERLLKQKIAANTILHEDIGKLKNDSYIELRARQDLGLVKPNEIQYYVLTKKQKMKKALKKVEKPWFSRALNFLEQTFVK